MKTNSIALMKEKGDMERKAMRTQSNILVYLWHAECSRCKIPEAVRKDSAVVRSLGCGARAHFSSPAVAWALSFMYKMGILLGTH